MVVLDVSAGKDEPEPLLEPPDIVLGLAKDGTGLVLDTTLVVDG